MMTLFLLIPWALSNCDNALSAVNGADQKEAKSKEEKLIRLNVNVTMKNRFTFQVQGLAQYAL